MNTMYVASGSVSLAYRPIAFDGRLDPTRVLLALGFGGEQGVGDGPAVPIEPTGEAVTLSGASLSDTNSLQDPERIVPRTATANMLGTRFTREVPAYSVTVLKLKSK